MAEDEGSGGKVETSGGGLRFPSPIRSYDVHIYFWQTDPVNSEKARSLREEIIEKFPELNVYKFWDSPIGPHPTGMFEVDLKTPEEFAVFVPWIQVNRRGLSVLVHPNTGRALNDHTVNAIWIGDKQVLNTTYLDNNEVDYGTVMPHTPPPGGWPPGMLPPPGWGTPPPTVAPTSV